MRHGPGAEPSSRCDGVDGVGRHLAVGRELAAGDRDEAGRRPLDPVSPGKVGRAGARCVTVGVGRGEQRAKAGPRRGDVLGCERLRDRRVDGAQDVGDVLRLDLRIVQWSVVVGVRGAEVRVLVPRYDEDGAAVFGDRQDRGEVAGQLVVRDREMDALGRPQGGPEGRVVEPAELVGPDAGRVHDDLRTDFEGICGLLRRDGCGCASQAPERGSSTGATRTPATCPRSSCTKPTAGA